jgi:hypothetical protein
MIGDHHIGEVADGRVLRSLERKLARLDLELVAARRLGKEAGRQQRIVEVDRWRRRPRASGERDRSTDQDPEFPHRGFSLCYDCSGGETGKEARGS